MSNEGQQTLLVLEDLQESIGKLSKIQQSELTSFLTKSRHKNISIIYILHRFPFNASNNSTFDRSFFENMTHIALFKFTQNTLHVNIWAGRVFSDKLKAFKQAFELAHKIAEEQGHNRSYILVTLGESIIIYLLT